MTQQMSFQDVLDALMLEESEPSHEALLRWSERYPQYRYALKEFFATWAIQKYRPGAEPEIDEEWIVEQGVNHVMEILRKQGRLISPESIEPLGEYDQLVLTAVYLLQGKGSPATIALKVSEMMEKRPLLASIFSSLDRLEQKSLVSWRYADPEEKAKQYFTITLAGERALAHAKETSTVVARFLPDFA